MKNNVHVNGGIIGLTPNEIASLNSIDAQRNLLANVTSMLLPKYKKQLLKLALPCLRMQAKENLKTSSFFIGQAQLPEDVMRFPEKNNQEFLHLATIDLKKMEEVLDVSRLKQFLSFYLSIHET